MSAGELLNHAPSKCAENPKDLDASETTSMSGRGDIPGKSHELTPFHEDKKVCHHSTSRENCKFRRMG